MTARKNNRRDELIALSGQAINGILSADGTTFSRIVDRALHAQVAKTAVDIAKKMLEYIEEEEKSHD